MMTFILGVPCVLVSFLLLSHYHPLPAQLAGGYQYSYCQHPSVYDSSRFAFCDLFDQDILFYLFVISSNAPAWRSFTAMIAQ
jgi:hypothetical protein